MLDYDSQIKKTRRFMMIEEKARGALCLDTVERSLISINNFKRLVLHTRDPRV